MSHSPKDIEAQLPLPPATFHVLLALAKDERHGYGIIQDVEHATEGELRLSAGTLYRTLQRLVERGMIVESSAKAIRALDDPRRRYYRLTEFGSAVARAETARLTRMVRIANATGLMAEAT